MIRFTVLFEHEAGGISQSECRITVQNLYCKSGVVECHTVVSAFIFIDGHNGSLLIVKGYTVKPAKKATSNDRPPGLTDHIGRYG